MKLHGRLAAVGALTPQFLALEVRIPAELRDGQSVVERLNESGSVIARLERDEIVIRPRGPGTLTGVPAYYNGRPDYRGRLVIDASGGPALAGVVYTSGVPVLTTFLCGVMAVIGALTGALIVLSGDPTGFVAMIGSAAIGTLAAGGGFLLRRLSVTDERLLVAALRSIGEQPDGPDERRPYQEVVRDLGAQPRVDLRNAADLDAGLQDEATIEQAR